MPLTKEGQPQKLDKSFFSSPDSIAELLAETPIDTTCETPVYTEVETPVPTEVETTLTGGW